MSINDGGPAFPLSPGDVPYYDPGMSLRDWFAGQALAGLCAHYGTPNGASVDAMPNRAYRIADAMLAARQEPPHDR